MPCTLAQVVDASAAARFCTPAQFDYALASGATNEAARLVLVSGASFLTECERLAGRADVTLPDVQRRERILDEVMA